MGAYYPCPKSSFGNTRRRTRIESTVGFLKLRSNSESPARVFWVRFVAQADAGGLARTLITTAHLPPRLASGVTRIAELANTGTRP